MQVKVGDLVISTFAHRNSTDGLGLVLSLSTLTLTKQKEHYARVCWSNGWINTANFRTLKVVSSASR